MGEKPLPPGLHAILGDSAAGTFKQTFAAGDSLLVDRDVLSCGPTPRCDDLEAWESVRVGFWNSVVPPDPGDEPHTTMGVLDRVRKRREAQRVTIWAGTGVSEQLSIAGTIHLAEQGTPAPGK